MKRQSEQSTRLPSTGRTWLRSMAGLPASLTSMRARQSEHDWLGWDGWVSCPQMNRTRSEGADLNSHGP
jgi:hypothetical protein